MSKSTDDTLDRAGQSRRTFLKAGVAGVSAGAASIGASVAPAQAAQSDAEKKKARYQESAHVKKFYAVNRY